MINLGPFFYRANFVKRHWADMTFRMVLIRNSVTHTAEKITH